MPSHHSLTQIDCPVCSRESVADTICPNCDTDLSLLRMMSDLEPVPQAALTVEPSLLAVRRSHLIIWIMLLLSSIAFGCVGYAVTTIQNHWAVTASTVTPESNSEISSLLAQKSQELPPQNQPCFNYVVRSGDNLTQLALNFYHDAQKWQTIADANPKLQQAPNQLEIADTLCIPNL